jgi:GT2 family glycosyltransferase
VRADVAVICNPDLTLDAACIERLQTALVADERAIVAGAALATNETPPRVNAFALRLTWDLLGINIERGAPFESLEHQAAEAAHKPLGPSGALFALHVPRYQAAIGGPLFIGSLFLYLEDVALWLRLRGADAKILFCPSAHAVHAWSSSAGQRSARKLYFVERNRLWLLRALRGRAMALALLPFTALRYAAYLLQGRGAQAQGSETARGAELLGAFWRALIDGLAGPLPDDLSGAFSRRNALSLRRYSARLRDQLRNPVE